ncbi:sensor histidine kinase [Paraburkholderia hospita]|jgi:signal transduction histidine kinase|uniref:sensor histidine kinase n=1 Tax=Paraburkholderia hospita TaxID=169430 RepID=UPI0009A6431D|nr:sensor histidine kinase [Paraburkholderia hospita]SKC88405.1 histidine kinase [Paraburkholderia hospita]
MRLADFILDRMDAILSQWEVFARTLLPAAADMRTLALRDHAQQILEAVARDLSTSQSREEQTEKSTGQAPILAGAPETAAQMHALLRARSGFDINQMVAEYRALRASVLRLWMDDCPPDSHHEDDMVRFNEAIDQAIAESVRFFSLQVDLARNLFLGMLGHDMRSPLQTIQITASYLAALNAGEKVSGAASRLIRSGTRMQALLDDMVDFNRTRLGLGINIAPTNVDLAQLVADELDLLRVVYPDRQIDLDAVGDCMGIWDGRRLQQLLGNLVLNAIKYGAQDAPVRVIVTGEGAGVLLEVRNAGTVIGRSTLDRIFDPLQRGPEHQDTNTGSSLGLGLYIAREIAKAHGGVIDARSDATETVFSVNLPRGK